MPFLDIRGNLRLKFSEDPEDFEFIIPNSPTLLFEYLIEILLSLRQVFAESLPLEPQNPELIFLESEAQDELGNTRQRKQCPKPLDIASEEMVDFIDFLLEIWLEIKTKSLSNETYIPSEFINYIREYNDKRDQEIALALHKSEQIYREECLWSSLKGVLHVINQDRVQNQKRNKTYEGRNTSHNSSLRKLKNHKSQVQIEKGSQNDFLTSFFKFYTRRLK